NCGYALVEQGDYATGYAKITKGSRIWQEGGGLLQTPFMKMMGAKAAMGLACYDEARSLLDEALDLTNQTGHKMYEAELHRVRGELQRQQPITDVRAAETSFLNSLEVARAQEAKGFELRAAISLARLWQSRGDHREACELLAPIYNWFTEGFDTRDLREAKALLEELGNGDRTCWPTSALGPRKQPVDRALVHCPRSHLILSSLSR